MNNDGLQHKSIIVMNEINDHGNSPIAADIMTTKQVITVEGTCSLD